MPDLVLVDSYAQIYRCFFAMRMPMSAPDGTPVNALYGIARFLLQLEKMLPSTYGAFVFDKGKAVRRVALCPEYKAQRPPMPESLRAQVGLIRQWVQAFGWPILEQEGLEADDLIAAIARRRGECVVKIVTHDKDISQLVADSGVQITYPEKGDNWPLVGREQVLAKFGVPPEQVAEYLALVGDTADNIIGVQGIGPKRAAELLQKYGSISEILAHADDLPGKTLGPTMKNSAALLERNLRLTRLDDQLPDGYTGLPERKAPDWAALREMATAVAFKSLLPLIEKAEKAAQQPGFLF